MGTKINLALREDASAEDRLQAMFQVKGGDFFSLNCFVGDGWGASGSTEARLPRVVGVAFGPEICFYRVLRNCPRVLRVRFFMCFCFCRFFWTCQTQVRAVTPWLGSLFWRFESSVMLLFVSPLQPRMPYIL